MSAVLFAMAFIVFWIAVALVEFESLVYATVAVAACAAIFLGWRARRDELRDPGPGDR